MPRDRRTEWRVQLRYGIGDNTVKVDQSLRADTAMEALKSVDPDLLPSNELPLTHIEVGYLMRGY